LTWATENWAVRVEDEKLKATEMKKSHMLYGTPCKIKKFEKIHEIKRWRKRVPGRTCIVMDGEMCRKWIVKGSSKKEHLQFNGSKGKPKKR